MSTLAAYRLGPHHGPVYEPFGVLSYSRQQKRHVLTEFPDRAAADAARAEFARTADAFALLLAESAGEWAAVRGGSR